MENIGVPQQENSEKKQETIQEKIYSLQLEYVDRIRKGTTPFPIGFEEKKENLKLGQLLSLFTNIHRELSFQYSKRTGKEGGSSNTAYSEFIENIYTDIRDAYIADPDTWTSSVRGIIAENLEKIPKAPTDEHSVEYKKNSAGLLTYNTASLGNFMKRKAEHSFLVEEFAHHGLTEHDEYIAVHFEPLAEKKSDIETDEVLNHSNPFSTLAEKIVENNPETRVIIGQSWLFDRPRAERFGFHLSPSLPINGSLGTWYQFVDKDGNLKKEEVERLLETGDPRYHERDGYMLVEEFLQKYLPEEKRGVVHLKKINPQYTELLRSESEKLTSFRASWDSASVESVENSIKNIDIMNKFCEETDTGKKMYASIIEQKKAGKSYLDMMKSQEFELYRNEYHSFKEAMKYIDYTIDI